ncbi:hypothetical protein COCSADRAFT_351596 [Bipolaris sorokiniana ND90Pr]|uniref:Uncharacterized protein n=1 Tax=Cochliobolus sativus (strain ND90Pr / ATCC 201652) TaxID=665912 RepID=M2SII3_COCSN|nr:uncharacterized protein COCSADRAFT_351596 [Bipolaris sorokiniana ND90Pr]EMD67008.1 hypothetical protein COCSADRAFT_351596 [Bipolaris sorokiniana ND90Pr]
MPFDFDAYDKKCSQMSPEELHLEWNHYTRLISGAAASATLGGSALVFTGGVSIIGVAIGSAGFYNARKKRQILKRHLDREHRTNRKRDIVGSAAFNGAVGLTTLGLGTLGAEKVLELGIENGVFGRAAETGVKVATGVVVNGVNTAADDRYHTHKKKREAKRACLAVERKHEDGQKKRSTRVLGSINQR